MRKYIASFVAFLLPIVRKVIMQVTADTINDVVYSDGKGTAVRRRTPYSYYDRRPSRARRAPKSYHEMVATDKPYNYDNAGFHDVLLVAFDLTGPNARETHQWLMDNIPSVGTGGDNDEIYLDSWWVANDERYDRSDTDSAVFVTPGKQAEARDLLRKYGLAL